MALEELVRTVESEAVTRIEEVRRRGTAEAERLRHESEAELSRRRTEALALRERELRAAAARDVEAARRDAARRFLQARAMLLARIREGVEQRLAARAGDPLIAPLLRRDREHGMRYFGEQAVEVEEGAGVILRAADRSLTVDATLATRLAQSWPLIAIDLARGLEAGP